MKVRCSSPIDAAVLSDYWLGLLSNPGEEGVEEHLFQCDSCGDRLRDVIALSEGIRRLAREGSLRMVVSETFLRRAAEEGRKVRQYAPPAGGSVECTVTSEDDFLIGRLAADFSNAERVDLCLCNASGVEQLRLPDIPINRDAGGMILQESITFAKAAPSNKMIMRLVSVDEAGSERPLGEYIFNHTRSMPGPAAW